MKTRIASLLLAMVLVVGAAACSQSPAPASSQPDSPSGPGTSSSAESTQTGNGSVSSQTTGTGESVGSPTTTGKGGTTSTRSRAPQPVPTTKPSKKAVTKMNYTPATKGLPGTKSKELLDNPNRGFRLELTLNPATGTVINGTTDAIQYLKDQLAYYEEDSPRVAQNYYYLTDYSHKDLDQKAFDNLQKYFDALKANHVQSMVRFAYEYDENNNVTGPTTQQMLRHMQQLKPFLEKNKATIHVVQAGFIGLWGEWHHSVHTHDQKKVLEGIVDMTPAGKFVQVRLASYKNVLDANDPRRARVSYHDDYLVGVDHTWSTAIPSRPDEYQMMLSDCVNMLVDGEMPWGSDKYFNNGVIDGLAMAQRLQRFHYSTMSVVHNYKEGSMYANYNMAQWKTIQVNESYLKSNGLRYAPNWLKDEKGGNATRSLFAYIRDYLGYYIEASDVSVKVSGKSVSVNLNLRNYGFSAPHGMDKMEVVLTDATGKVLTSQSVCAMGDLQPEKTVKVTKTLTASELYAGYQVGIRFTNQQGAPAKLANDIPYQKGINVLTVLE